MRKILPARFFTGLLSFLCLIGLARPAYSQNANATVHFDQLSGRTINKGAFGLNLFQGFDPDQAGTPGNPAYKEAMAFMNPGIVRYHSWEMMGQSTNRNGWLTSTNQWDAAKINNALSGANAYNPLVMMNIPGWPDAWKDADGKLLPSRYTDFANWCADLVRIINIDQGRGIRYWEITNERDDVYHLECDELGRIYNQAAAAMKAVDPTILTGGPAFARPDLTAQVDAFFSTAAPNLDFVTYHTYANGTPNSPTQDVYNSAASNARATAGVRTGFAKYSSRTIEYFHDEYNISWSPPDPHQSSYVSMLFDAIFMINAIKEGATGTMAWNECDGWYGKMDNSYNKRPSAYMFHNFNANLIGGSVCNSSVSNDAALVVLASKKNNLLHLVVVNRSDADQRYKFTITGLPAGVTASTVFTNAQNQPIGGIVTKQVTYSELTGGTGALFEKNTVSLLTLDVSNIGGTTLRNPENPTNTVGGLEYKYVEGSWSTLPNFDALTAAESGNVAGFDMSVRNRTDNYGFKYTGFVNVPSDGTYTFYTSSDDGSKLYIGTQEVVNNDGLHAMQERSGTIGLKAGKHAIAVTFFEAGGGEGLSVSYSGPGVTKQTIPNSALFRASGSNSGGFSGTYKITARHSGKVLDVSSSSTVDGGNVQQWTDNGSWAQQWIITATTDGYYKIVCKVSGKALDVNGASTADGANVQQWGYVGGNNQQWRIEATTDGYYKLTARHSGKALDVDGSSTADGGNVQQWGYVGGNNQQWKLELLSTATTRASFEKEALEESVGVYPNPARSSFYVKIYSEKAQEAKLFLANSQGRNVVTKVKRLQAGENTVSIPVDQLPAGLYLLKVQKAARQVTQKVLIAH